MKRSEFIRLLEEHNASLDYSFKENEKDFILAINGNEIKFQKSSSAGKFKPNDWLRKKHKEGKVHEPGLLATWVLLSKLIKHEVVFYDIGSLFGYHANVISSFIAKSNCILIEGNPITSTASKKILASRNFEFINCVVGKDNKPRWYFVDEYNFFPAISYKTIKNEFILFVKNLAKIILRLFGYKYRLNSYRRFFKIPTCSIPTLLSGSTNKQIVVKVDTEGHQFKFLLLYVEYLKQNDCILLIELDKPEKMKMLGGSNQELIQKLGEAGYAMFWLDHREPCKIVSIEQFCSWMDQNSLVICLPDKILENLSF